MPGRSVVTNLVLNVAGYLGPLKAAAAGTKEFGSEFDKASKQGGKGFDQLATGAAVAGGAILLGFGMAVKSAMEFDKQMSAVGAAANATGKDLDALRAAALQAGKDTSFSAREAAQGEEELAKAGVSVKDIMGGGLKGALDLAAAGTIGVGDAAEIAATAMTQFKLQGSQVPHVADLLASAANKAQGSVMDVGMALKQGGLVASQFGVSIEETTGTLAAFASAGLIGSDAGTSLKTTLLMLGNPTQKSAQLMKELGINAYDASGNFVGMAGLAGQLRSQLSGLTQEQRNAAMAQIFGADAVRAANVLYENGAEGIAKWTDEVDDSGAAARTAAAKTDNLAGDLDRLKGSFETALIEAGSQGTGVLRTLAQAADGAVTTFSSLPGPLQAGATILVLITGSALAAAGAYGVMAPKVREASAALAAQGAAGRMANTALIGTAKGAGKAAVAFAALQVVGAIAGNFADAAPDVDRLTRALTKFANTGQSSGEMTRVFDQDLKRLTDGLSFIRNSGGLKGAQNASALESIFQFDKFSFSVSKHLQEIGSIDKALAGMVSSGNAAGAAAAVSRFGLSTKEIGEFLPAYAGAINDADAASEKAGNSMETGAGQAKVLAGGMADAVKEAGSLADALSGLNDVNISAAEAGIGFQLSMNGLTKELRDNKGAWQGNTDAALNNRQAVIDRITAGQDFLGKQYEQTLATKGDSAANQEAARSHATMRASIINAAVAAGINRQAVVAMVDQLFRVPKNTAANVSTPGAVPSALNVQHLRTQISALQGKTVIASAQLQGDDGVRRLYDSIARLHNREIWITTKVRGPGALDRESLGLGGFAKGGINLHKAAGGLVHATTAPPGTLFQWAEPETGGEAFIPKRGDRRRSTGILSEAASWYDMRIVPMAGGGLMDAANEVLGRLRSGQVVYEDLSYKGNSANLRSNNRALSDAIEPYFPGGRYSANPTLMANALQSYISASKGTSGAVSWSGAATSSGAGSSGGGSQSTAGGLGPVHVHFHGPVGSRTELENWLTRSFDNLRRQGRV